MGKDDKCEIIKWFNEVSENASVVQQETLRKIIEVNQGSEYLKKWLGDIKISSEDEDVDDASTLERIFTTSVPLISHADIEPFILRIADGSTSPLLTQHPITHLSLSSGTTEGRQKYVPFTQHSAQTTLLIFKLATAYISRIYPTKPGGRILEFIYSSKQMKTKGGLTVGTATTHYFSSKEFKIKQEMTKCFTCSPHEVISSGDYLQSTYCHLLLGLFFSKNIEFISSTFVYSIVQAFSTLEELWNDLCEDIKQGQLSSRISIPSVRESVLKLIYPKPGLASRIRQICVELESSSWMKLIPKIWPNAKYVLSIMTGSMEHYIRKLRHYAGNVPLISAHYGSTESWIGVNIDPTCPPEEVTYAVIPTLSYFEFIPVYTHRKNGDVISTIDDFAEEDPVPLSKVKVGQQYEIVLTTFTGLYRYRLGDVVEVSGFYKGTPKLTFVCRRNLMLTVNIDKNTEKDLQLAVEAGSQLLSQQNRRAELVDFTSHADVESQPGHYIVYWEIKGDVDETVLVECCKKMDESFVDHGYVVSRKASSIGPLELRIVETGTFKKILDHFIGNGAALSQFKTPRCVNNNMLIKILNVCTIKRFHSTAYC